MSAQHLTLRQLRAVEAVYATRRISAAAERLAVTQSAVSVLVRQAEEALGTRLFDRTTRSLVPTAAAEQAIGLIERVLGDLDSLGMAVAGLRELQHGQVRLTATPATGMAVLPPTVRRFRASYPGVSLVLDDCAPNQFYSLIRQEKAEFGVGTPPAARGEFDWTVLHEDPLCVVCDRDHPLAARERLGWRELEGVPLIISRREYGVRTIVEQTFASLDLRPTLAAEIGFFGSAAWMVSCGIGTCILPSLLAHALAGPELALLRLDSPVVTRPLAIVKRRGRTLSPAASRFATMLAEDVSGGHAPQGTASPDL